MRAKTIMYGIGAGGIAASTWFLNEIGINPESIGNLFEERAEQPYIPPEKQGSIEDNVGRQQVGQISQVIISFAEKDRTLDRAIAVRATQGVKDIYIEGLSGYHSSANDQVYYSTQVDDNGRNIGFSRSGLEFQFQAPESDMRDGEDDELCATDIDDVEWRGCEIAAFAYTGWLKGLPGLGADNNTNLGYKLNYTDFQFKTNNRCLLDYYVIPIINEELAYYNERLEGPEMYNELADMFIRGPSRLQEHEAGIPPSRVMVGIDQSSDFIPDDTLNDVFAGLSGNNPENVPTPTVPDDHCVLDSQGDLALADMGDIRLIAHMGRPIVAEYFNPDLYSFTANPSTWFDEGNEFYAAVDQSEFEEVIDRVGS